MAKGAKGSPSKLQQIEWKRQREYKKILASEELRRQLFARITAGIYGP